MSDECGFENPPFESVDPWSRRSGLMILGDEMDRPEVLNPDWQMSVGATRSKMESELPVEARV
jgi:hypothetical protein